MRVLQGLSLRISNPRVFLSEILVRMRDPVILQYLAKEGGADRLLDSLTDLPKSQLLLDYLSERGAARFLGQLYQLALNDLSLRESLIKSEIGDVFRALYLPTAQDPYLRSYLAERGINDLFGYTYVMAQDAKLPLAQRAESYSQEGEDLIVGRLFDGVLKGFFVDVGAHHPFRFSNTWLLYKRGWRGINIDATPGSMEEFRRWRPRDINLECLVSTDTRARPYFLHDEPALNTMSEDLVRRRAEESPQYKVTGTVMLPAKSLSTLLEEGLPKGQAVDFLNIDVEGHDLDVLKSNDWEKFHPKVIAAELLATSIADVEGNEIYRFLADRNYRLYAKMFNSAIFTAA